MQRFNFQEISVEFDKESLTNNADFLDYEANIELERMPQVGDQIFIDERNTFSVKKIVHIAANEEREPYTMILGTRT